MSAAQEARVGLQQYGTSECINAFPLGAQALVDPATVARYSASPMSACRNPRKGTPRGTRPQRAGFINLKFQETLLLGVAKSEFINLQKPANPCMVSTICARDQRYQADPTGLGEAV